MAPARPIGVLFLLQRSCLASAVHWAAVTADWLWVFALRWSLGTRRHSPRRARSPTPPSPGSRWPPFPGVSAGGGRHPPDRVDGHRRRGVKHTAFDRHASSRIRDVEDLNRRRGRSRCLCQRTRVQGLSARRGDLGSAWDRRCGLRPGAHRRAGVERAEPVARRGRARLTGSCGCLVQCFADELDLFTGFAERQAAQRGGALCRALRAFQSALGGSGSAAVGADPERGEVGVRVAAADAPLRRAVVALIGAIELVQRGADTPRCPVLATAQAEGVAKRCRRGRTRSRRRSCRGAFPAATRTAAARAAAGAPTRGSRRARPHRERSARGPSPRGRSGS